MIPSFALVMALASKTSDPTALRKLFDDAGLETRYRTDDTFNEHPRALDVCRNGVDSKFCSVMPAFGTTAPRIINFHFDPPEDGAPTTAAQRSHEAVLNMIAADSFNDDRASSIASDIIMIAGTAPSLRDTHVTPVGRIPGAVVMANAAYAFANGQFLQVEASGFPSWSEFLTALLLALGTAMLCAAVTIPISTLIRSKGEPVQLEEVFEWTWPAALVITSSLTAVWAWNRIHADFSEGLLSFAIIGFGFAVLHVGLAVEHLLERPSDALMRRGYNAIRSLMPKKSA